MRNFGNRNRLGFWDAKNPSGSPYKYARVPAQNRAEKRENLQHTTRLNLPAAPPRTLLHPVSRRAPVIGRAGLRNLVLNDPAQGKGK
jgi:hypothetical protein